MLNTNTNASAVENIALKRSYKNIIVILTVLLLCGLLGMSAMAANNPTASLQASVPEISEADYFTSLISLEESKGALLERMEAAHLMATSARQLGYGDDHPIIIEAQTVYATAMSEYEQLDTRINETCQKMSVPFSVYVKSGISVDGFNKILAGTGLAGRGQDFYDMEQTHNVNGLFAVAVSRIESGMGVTNYSKTRNNHFGLIGKNFADTRECVMYFGELMNRGMYKGKTIDQIAATYCPPNRTKWASNAYIFMNDAWNKMLRD